jgi:hypothetical protein
VAARNEASAKIAEALQEEMAKRGLTRADVVKRIEEHTGRKPGRQWVSRTLSGGSHFTELAPTEVPNELLRQVVSAIEPNQGKAEKLARDLGKLATRK